MATKPLSNIWIRQQQCPCGDWKCYLRYDGDDQSTSINSDLQKNEPTPSSLSLVEPVFTPYVGQIFKTDSDAFEYYSNFARKNGFSIRKARSTESQNLGVYRRDFVCYRSGFNQPRKKANVEHPRDRKSVRCGCDAKLYLTKEIVDGVSQWYISQFSNVHNHELLEDDQVRLLPAYRKIHETDQERIVLLSKAGFPVNRIVKVLELEKGVQPGQLPFIEKDVRNFVRTCKKTVQENDVLLTEKKENDTLDLLEACKGMAERDGDFAYDFTTGVNEKVEKVENVAWAYGESVRAYALYGDVVYLDTTYRSITYGLLLGVMFGMDNHGKAVLFGCFLLQDESCHSFAWALETFVRFMKGRQPQTIITDVDSGIRDAIAKELADAKHVIGIWHVMSKLSSWFSLLLGQQYGDFRAEFDIICHLEGVEEFEHQWNLLIGRFGLVSDKHVPLLYSYRGSWSMIYLRGCFLARLLTPEFSQSVDLFLKRILNGQSCLQVFFEQVNAAANCMNRAKNGIYYSPIKTCTPIEEHARSILTPYAFNIFQHEIVLSMQYGAQELPDGSYLIRHFKKMDGEYFIIWIPEEEQVHCSCKEFEHSGILCRHSLRLLQLKNCFELPEKYFPLRWRSSVEEDPNAESHSDECAQTFHILAASLLTESMISKDRFSYVHREISTLLDHVRSMPAGEESLVNVASNNGVAS